MQKSSQNKVGYLGPKGTFSHQAALKISKNFVAFESIRDIFEAVQNKKINFGLVPAENSLGGIVSETINNLINYNLKVSGSLNLKIHHCFLSKSKNIKTIKSHVQAFSQCRNWLNKNYPKAKLESAPSTTACLINPEPSTGYIASEIASKIYNLKILYKNIEDSKNNITKFYLISKKLRKTEKAKRTLLLLAVKDRVGVLRDILDIFVKQNLNLSSLHSIPSRKKPWDYFFFVQVDSLEINKAAKQLNGLCQKIRILGFAS